MCKNCYDLTIQLECIIWAIAEIVLCVVLIGFTCSERRYDPIRIVLLVALSVGVLAGFCFFFGASLKKRIILVVWIVLICPAIVTIILMYCLVLKGKWKRIHNMEKTQKILGMIVVFCWIVYLVYLSRLLIIEIKTGKRQKRYPDCVGGHYPRGALRERTRASGERTRASRVVNI